MIDIEEIELELNDVAGKICVIISLLAEIKAARELRKAIGVFNANALVMATGHDGAANRIADAIRNYDKVRG